MKYIIYVQSHVVVSLETPEYTANCDGIGNGVSMQLGFFGLTKKQNISGTLRTYIFIKESRKMRILLYPIEAPYAAVKLYAYWIIK